MDVVLAWLLWVAAFVLTIVGTIVVFTADDRKPEHFALALFAHAILALGGACVFSAKVMLESTFRRVMELAELHQDVADRVRQIH